jgi:glycerophosphoryl diester phosphodiesterase
MEIIAHRGLWKIPEEKNTLKALCLALDMGYGVETDIRDLNGTLVISHDMPTIESFILLDDFLSYYSNNSFSSSLALNIKSDGLQEKLKKALAEYAVEKYFVFDMSIPDAYSFLDGGMITFLRRSEVENYPDLLSFAQGVWLDELRRPWISRGLLIEMAELEKKVCIVSAELHNRDYEYQWALIKGSLETSRLADSFMICTDVPDKAEGYFN